AGRARRQRRRVGDVGGGSDLGGADLTVIVKWVRTGVDRARSERWRLGTEAAALRFLSENLGLAIAPRVIAEDADAGFLVLEDLAPRVALDLLICRDGAAAHHERLAVFARALGELGAGTAGREELYRTRSSAVGSAGSVGSPSSGAQDRFAGLWERAHDAASALEAPIGGSAASELTAGLDELSTPGAFRALSNGDAESNNILIHPSGPADARLIDFEAAGYGHALLDAVCLHVPGPRWMSVGDPVANGLADCYRHALAEGVPEAQDDRRYGFGLAAACASWALLRLQRFAMLDERPPGDDSRLQLVEILEATARTAEAHHALPHLAGWFRRAAEALRRRWPDTDVDLTDPVKFPPYSPRR
uniref:phosphotransferase n=1 Tax=Catenulispora pinisilvae TaxID=2705253 RepID=UPI0018925A75